MKGNYTQRLKASIEPQLHLHVPQQEGSYNSPRWSNADLDPVPPEKRTWGALDYWCEFLPVLLSMSGTDQDSLLVL